MRRTRHNANKDLKKSEIAARVIECQFTFNLSNLVPNLAEFQRHQLLRVSSENNIRFDSFFF